MNKERRKMVNNIFQNYDVSALIFWRPDELVLMSGYMPLWGLSVLVYTADHEPVLFVPELEPEDLLPANISIQKFPWGNKDCSDPWEVLYKEIKEVLKKKGIQNKPVSFIKNIGGTAPCRMSGEQPPLPADFVDCLSRVSDGGFRHTTVDMLLLYQYKTPDDVRGIKLAHKVAAIAVDTFYKQLQAGISEAKLAALIEYAVSETIGQNEINFARAWPMIQSGKNAGDGGRYNRSTGKIIEAGELVMLEMAVCVNGYWADISRTSAVGEITSRQSKIFETVKKAQQLAIWMLRPGIRMGEIDRASREYISDAGFGSYFNHALGHQVGFRYHDPGARLAPESTDILEEGMVLTVEPGIYGMDLNGGVRIEDNILITANGNCILSDYPRSLRGD
jgi:Xaa-Pro aminopeptidase